MRARAASGDATPSEITDAETALTRAQAELFELKLRLSVRDRKARIRNGDNAHRRQFRSIKVITRMDLHSPKERPNARDIS